jgi:catechol 2,3-dioxygenase-like lactoylglutathione lyase family enzyme
MLHVPDFAAAFDFFTRVLRFSVPFRDGTYAYFARDRAAVRVLEDSERPPIAPDDARLTVYFDADDVDALFAELQPDLATLPANDVRPPVDQPWHQREFHVRLPDGNWLAFGQPVRA